MSVLWYSLIIIGLALGVILVITIFSLLSLAQKGDAHLEKLAGREVPGSLTSLSAAPLPAEPGKSFARTSVPEPKEPGMADPKVLLG